MIKTSKTKLGVFMASCLLATACFVHASSAYKLQVNGKEIKDANTTLVQNGQVMVPIRVVTETLGGTVTWNDKTSLMTIKTAYGDKVEITALSNKLKLNGTTLAIDVRPVLNNGRLFINPQLIGELNHATVSMASNQITIIKKGIYTASKAESIYDTAKKTGTSVEDLMLRNQLKTTKIAKGQKLKIIIPYILKFNEDRVNTLGRIIEAEARGESMQGKIAVGNVIINRMNNKQFPNTIKGVIFQKNQFSPVKSGKIYSTKASTDSLKAAVRVINGENVVKDALYFYNPKLTKETFFSKLTYIMRIGNHQFLK
ncbi:hypothetical protein CN918_25305 [Priestia megaterium]|nr:hypothetical protein CN918_25305 [Priestia megaterium]